MVGAGDECFCPISVAQCFPSCSSDILGLVCLCADNLIIWYASKTGVAKVSRLESRKVLACVPDGDEIGDSARVQE